MILNFPDMCIAHNLPEPCHMCELENLRAKVKRLENDIAVLVRIIGKENEK